MESRKGLSAVSTITSINNVSYFQMIIEISREHLSATKVVMTFGVHFESAANFTFGNITSAA